MSHSLNERNDDGLGHVPYRRWQARRFGQRNWRFGEIVLIVILLLFHLAHRCTTCFKKITATHRISTDNREMHLILPFADTTIVPRWFLSVGEILLQFMGAVHFSWKTDCVNTIKMLFMNPCFPRCQIFKRSQWGLAWTQIIHPNSLITARWFSRCKINFVISDYLQRKRKFLELFTPIRSKLMSIVQILKWFLYWVLIV